jgi:Raf kinase inhibitor-like YbhB/YbcL family protein
MKISSLAFNDHAEMPVKYAYATGNINPPLTISDIPPSAQSLSIIMHDPDAPSGDFVHWLVWNISTFSNAIAAGSTPAEANQGLNDFGHNRYDGPAPPSGTHRYVFTLYAIAIRLALPNGSSRSELEAAMTDRILATAELTGLYKA